MQAQPTCQDRVREEFEDRMDDLRKLWTAYTEGDEDRHSEELGNFHEYGLCFDYVPRGTFGDQKQGYFRYQLSWGGPGDEFRFFCDMERTPYKVEYWFLDWFDGAPVELSGEDETLLLEIFEWFSEMGSVEAALKDAS